MSVTEVQTAILDIFNSSCCEYQIPDNDTNLFDSRCKVLPRDLLFVFMELKKKYPGINFAQWVPDIQVFTVRTIAEAICKQINT